MGRGSAGSCAALPALRYTPALRKPLSLAAALPARAETAARDRLGKGHKIEIKPLSSILDRIKQRQALAIARCGMRRAATPAAAACCAASCLPATSIEAGLHRRRPPFPFRTCRAPKAALPDVGNFDDLLAQARQQGGTAAEQTGGDEPAAAAVAAAEARPSPFAAALAAAARSSQEQQQQQPQQQQQEQEQEEEEQHGADDLEILGSDEEGSQEGGAADLRLVELPTSTKKKRERLPFITQARWAGAGVRAGAHTVCCTPSCLLFAGVGWLTRVPSYTCSRWTAMKTRC